MDEIITIQEPIVINGVKYIPYKWPHKWVTGPGPRTPTKGVIPSVKLTWHLKIDGWKTTFLLGFGLFSAALAVSFRTCNPTYF